MSIPSDRECRHLAGEGPEERKRSLAELFTAHRDRLETMVRIRLDPRVRARLSTSDVLQESYLEAQKRLEEYVRAEPMPFYLWLRRVTALKLIELQRHHLGAQKRAAGKETPIEPLAGPGATSEAMALSLLERGPTPSEALAEGEKQAALASALERMDPLDREVIALRHFERLTAPETAEVLGIKEEAAQKRYFRALKKMRAILESVPGMRGDQEP